MAREPCKFDLLFRLRLNFKASGGKQPPSEPISSRLRVLLIVVRGLLWSMLIIMLHHYFVEWRIVGYISATVRVFHKALTGQ